MNTKLKSEDMDFLFKSIMTLKNTDEFYSFFEDLCTFQELKSISQRLRVAKLLYERKVYNNIVSETGASTATISRVNRTLNYGSDGYKLVFERLEAQENGEA